MQLVPLSHSQNVDQGRRDFLQEQFPNFHKFSEAQPHLNTFIISSGTKQTFGATGKGIRHLVCSFLIHRGKFQLLEDCRSCNSAEENLFLTSNNSQEIHAEIQLKLNRYSFYIAHLQHLLFFSIAKV